MSELTPEPDWTYRGQVKGGRALDLPTCYLPNNETTFLSSAAVRVAHVHFCFWLVPSSFLAQLVHALAAFTPVPATAAAHELA